MARQLQLVLSSVLLLSACGGGGDGAGGSASCSPSPSINSAPPSQITVGQQYRYHVSFTMFCIPFFTDCGVELLGGPAGAGVDPIRGAVFWTPTAADVGAPRQFTLATKTDLCGKRATQSWSVRALPGPTIQSFSADKTMVAPGETVTLTAVFDGAGSIDGLGPVTSGVPVTSAPLLNDTTFRLRVANVAGVQVSFFASVEVLGPPTIASFSASPATIGIGSSSRLTWSASGDIDEVRITPPGITVARASSLVVTPTVTTTYVLAASNALASVNSSVQVTVVPAANIRSFGAVPSSSVAGGTVDLSADFDGTNGRIEQEANGIYTTFASVNSGDVIASGPLYHSRRYRLSVQNSVGQVVTRDLLVPLSGAGTFQPTSGQPLVPDRSYHTATRLLDGRVFIAGNRAQGATTEIFDPATQTFSNGPNLLVGRSRHQAVALPDGRVLIAGGCSFGSSCQQTEFFDPANGTMAFGPSLPGAAQGMAGLADGRVLILVSIPGTPPTRGAVILNPLGGSVGGLIQFVNPFWNPVEGSQALARMADGRILLFSTAPLRSEIFTPGPDSFLAAAAPNAPRVTGIAASVLLDGRLLLTGGAAPPDTVAEAYEPQPDRFVALSTQQIADGFGAYANQASTRLQDGRVLLVGGNGSPLAQLFDPATDTFSVTGGLRTGRGFNDSFISTLTATLLDDGRVLVVGGCRGLPCEAEIYTP